MVFKLRGIYNFVHQKSLFTTKCFFFHVQKQDAFHVTLALSLEECDTMWLNHSNYRVFTMYMRLPQNSVKKAYTATARLELGYESMIVDDPGYTYASYSTTIMQV